MKSTTEIRVKMFGWKPNGPFWYHKKYKKRAYSLEDALKKTPEYKGYLESGLNYQFSKPAKTYWNNPTVVAGRIIYLNDGISMWYCPYIPQIVFDSEKFRWEDDGGRCV